MSDTIFSKIIKKEIPADIVYEDELCMAFKDVNPQAPTHILLIPKKAIEKLSDISPEDSELMGHMLAKVSEITQELGISDAFRLVVNNGADAGQSVFHLHFHIIAGRPFTWPPG